MEVEYTDLKGNHAEEEGGIKLFEDRRPLIFDNHNEKLYVGGFNQSHWDAHNWFELDGSIDDENRYSHGMWFPHGSQHGGRGGQGFPEGNLEWLNSVADHHKEEINKILGATPRPKIWHFSSEGTESTSKSHRASTLGVSLDSAWQGLRTAHSLAWRPDASGKGYVNENGEVHTWVTDSAGRPHHGEQLTGIHDSPEYGLQGYDESRATTWPFNIEPSGYFSWTADQGRQDQPPVHPSQVDPRLRARFEEDEPGEWRFGSSDINGGYDEQGQWISAEEKVLSGANSWTPGNHGKGLQLADGRHLLWNVDEFDGFPTHPQVINRLMLPPWHVRGVTEMHANGSVRPANDTGYSDAWARELAEKHNQRFVPHWSHPEADETWEFTGERLAKRKTAGISRGKRLEILKQADDYHPDTSEVLHTFPDGWTIRKLQTAGDRSREGSLARHCWRGLIDGVEKADPIADSPYKVNGDHISLRDPDNWPHASLYRTSIENWNSKYRSPEDYNPEPHETEILHSGYGHGNNPIHPKYLNRINEWAQTQPQMNAAGADARTYFLRPKTFSKTAKEWQTPEGYPAWQHGSWGRYIVDHHGQEHRWHEDGPNHYDFIAAHPELAHLEMGYINEHGLHDADTGYFSSVADKQDEGWQIDGDTINGVGRLADSKASHVAGSAIDLPAIDDDTLGLWEYPEPVEGFVLSGNEKAVHDSVSLLQDFESVKHSDVHQGDRVEHVAKHNERPARRVVEERDEQNNNECGDQSNDDIDHSSNDSTQRRASQPAEWQLGQHGKAAIWGSLQEPRLAGPWATDENGNPHHYEVMGKAGIGNFIALVVEPDGGLSVLFGDPNAADDAAKLDPRLYVKSRGPMDGWDFGHNGSASDTILSKTAAKTRTQLLKDAEQVEQENGWKDSSEIEHQFPNGWTIRRLKTYGDLDREGQLMNNCWAHHRWVIDDVNPDTGKYEHMQPAWEHIAQPNEDDEHDIIWEEGQGFHSPIVSRDRLYSLRDPDNIPRVSIDSQDVLGRHNSDPQPEYKALLKNWQDAKHGQGNWEDGQGDVGRWGRTPWHFGRTAATQVLEHPHPYNSAGGGYEGRRPIVYDPRNDIVHVGADNEIHYDLINRANEQGHGLDFTKPRLYPQGWIGVNPEWNAGDKPVVKNQGQQHEYGWYDMNPGAHVDHALRNHFNAQAQEGWHFASDEYPRAANDVGVTNNNHRIHIWDSIDQVPENDHFIVLKNGKIVSAWDHHEQIMRGAGITQDQVAGMGGKYEGHVEMLSPDHRDMRMRWTFGKTAAATLPQQRRQWQDLSASFDAEPVGEPTPNGWTVYRHNNAASVNAVGKQLQNCWQGSDDSYDFSSYYTLHGPDGLPQVAFNVTGVPPGLSRQGYEQRLEEALAARNRKPTDEQYDELEAWAGQHPELYYDEMDRYRDQVSDWQTFGSRVAMQPSHNIEFTPGDPHKGYIAPDGSVHVWPTDYEGWEGAPHHTDIAIERGHIPDHNDYYDITPFYVENDEVSNVRTGDESYIEEKVLPHLPGTTMRTDWRFGRQGSSRDRMEKHRATLEMLGHPARAANDPVDKDKVEQNTVEKEYIDSITEDIDNPDTEPVTPAKMPQEVDTPRSPTSSHNPFSPLNIPDSPLDRPKTVLDSGACETVASHTLRSFLSSLTPSLSAIDNQGGSVSQYPDNGRERGGCADIPTRTSSTPITMGTGTGIGSAQPHSPSARYQVGGERTHGQDTGPGSALAYDEQYVQGQQAEDRPSFKEFPMVETLREAFDRSDRGDRTLYHNDQESQWNWHHGSVSHNWKPGQQGKWLITPDGDVHTWNVNRWGSPHHTEYAEYELGDQNIWDGDTEDLNEPHWYQYEFGDIGAQGVSTAPSKEYHQQFESLGLQPRTDQWYFGSESRLSVEEAQVPVSTKISQESHRGSLQSVREPLNNSYENLLEVQTTGRVLRQDKHLQELQPRETSSKESSLTSVDQRTQKSTLHGLRPNPRTIKDAVGSSTSISEDRGYWNFDQPRIKETTYGRTSEVRIGLPTVSQQENHQSSLREPSPQDRQVPAVKIWNLGEVPNGHTGTELDRPWAYSPSQNTVHIGPPNTYHSDLREHILDNGGPDIYRDDYSHGRTDFLGTQERHQAVLRALRANDIPMDTGWHFAQAEWQIIPGKRNGVEDTDYYDDDWDEDDPEKPIYDHYPVFTIGNTAYVGNPGTHHLDLINDFPEVYDAHMQNKAKQGLVYPEGKNLWWEGEPLPGLSDALAQHLGQPVLQGAGGWHFGKTKTASHANYYEPGQAGKWLITPEGHLHAWNVDGKGSPHHTEYAEDELGDYDIWDQDSGELQPHFFDGYDWGDIDENGNHHGADPRHYQLFQSFGLKPAQEEGEWHFGAAPPQVVRTELGDDYATHGGGLPYIYSPKTNNIYIADNDAYHWDLIDKVPELQEVFGSEEGAGAPPDMPGYGYGRIDDWEGDDGKREFGHEAYPNQGVPHKEIHKALEAHWGQPIYDAPQGDWRFASDYDIEDWKPGGYGKAFVINGQPKAWATDDIDGYPSHDQVAKSIGSNWERMMMQNASFYAIHPNGQFEFITGAELPGHHKTLQSILPAGLRPHSDEWHFGKTANEPLHYAPIVHANGHWILGENGDYHDDIIPIVSRPGDPFYDAVEDRGRVTQHDGKAILDWYNSGPQPHVVKELSEHLGMPVEEVAPGNWNFSKTANDLPEVVTAHEPSNNYNNPDLYKRRAFIYSPSEHKVYEGAASDHHDDVQRYFNLPWEKGRGLGVIVHEPFYGFGGSSKPIARWAVPPTAELQPILEMMAERHGVPAQPLDEEEWHFGAWTPTEGDESWQWPAQYRNQQNAPINFSDKGDMTAYRQCPLCLGEGCVACNHTGQQAQTNAPAKEFGSDGATAPHPLELMQPEPAPWHELGPKQGSALVNGGHTYEDLGTGEVKTSQPWAPGKHGKGTFSGTTGAPHLWAIDKNDAPHHDDAMYPDTADGYFYIEPNGEIEAWNGPQREQAVRFAEHHPDLTTPNPDLVPGWNFSKTASAAKLIWHGRPEFEEDHSMVYLPNHDELHIGEPSKHHDEIHQILNKNGYSPNDPRVEAAYYDGGFEVYDNKPNAAEHGKRIFDTIKFNFPRAQITEDPANFSLQPKTWNFSKVASKIEWLESRPDKWKETPVGQQTLEGLKSILAWYPKLDPLAPWIWREAKKGRLSIGQNGASHYTAPEGVQRMINLDTWSHLGDWYQSNSPTRRGVDIMQKTLTDVQGLVQEWDEELASKEVEAQADNGYVVYEYPNGWTMRELGPQDLDYEGDSMGHCVGGQGYQNAVENGETAIYSLRDQKNVPHATIEINKDDPYYSVKCGNCLKPLPPGEHVCDDCGEYNQEPGVPETLEQIQGKGNTILKPEYQAMVKEFFNSLPHKPIWKDGPDKIDEIEDLKAFNEAGPEFDHGWGGYGPHGDYGLDEKPFPVDYKKVLNSIRNDSYHNGDDWWEPDDVRVVYDHALKNNQIPELAKATHDYSDDHVKPDFDALEEMNYEYLDYPGEYEDDPERWDNDPQNHNDAYDEYEWKLNDLQGNHVPSQIEKEMWRHLNPHYNSQTGQYTTIQPPKTPTTFT